jgi:ParB/RepB/Spo0J family partition protein
MKIKMNEIKVASNELREKYDADKLRDLQWSLMEEGQVEPIKVCKNGGGGYEIVYGHRRYLAAEKAGWDEIEALVVEKDEVDNLIHAGIENLAKEDLSIMEKATWAERLVEMGMTEDEISRKATVSRSLLRDWITYKTLVDKGLFESNNVPHSMSIEIARAIGRDDIDTINVILKRAIESNYGPIRARILAYAYKNAETPELKEQVLKTGIGKNDTWEDVLYKARFEKVTRDQFPETFVFIPDWERELLSNENTHPYVKKFYNSINSARRHILLGPLFVQQDLFKPEQAKATIHKIDETIKELDEYKKSLMGVINE